MPAADWISLEVVKQGGHDSPCNFRLQKVVASDQLLLSCRRDNGTECIAHLIDCRGCQCHKGHGVRPDSGTILHTV